MHCIEAMVTIRPRILIFFLNASVNFSVLRIISCHSPALFPQSCLVSQTLRPQSAIIQLSNHQLQRTFCFASTVIAQWINNYVFGNYYGTSAILVLMVEKKLALLQHAFLWRKTTVTNEWNHQVISVPEKDVVPKNLVTAEIKRVTI